MRHLALLPVFVVAACSAGPSQTVTRSVELDNAETVAVDLKIVGGELHVRGGAPRLLDATFIFNVPEWEPVIDYRHDGPRATLTIRQPSSSASFRNTKNTWDLRLTDTVPIALTATVTAGEATMDLGSLTLRSVQVDAGAGEFTLDLRGTPRQSYDVRVNAGVGATHIRLPATVAIIATATSGVGGVNVSGLQKQATTWINAGHEQDPVAIHVSVSGGVGEIDLSAD